MEAQEPGSAIAMFCLDCSVVIKSLNLLFTLNIWKIFKKCIFAASNLKKKKVFKVDRLHSQAWIINLNYVVSVLHKWGTHPNTSHGSHLSLLPGSDIWFWKLCEIHAEKMHFLTMLSEKQNTQYFLTIIKLFIIIIIQYRNICNLLLLTAKRSFQRTS